MSSEEVMVSYFRTSDLKTLLQSFNCDPVGEKNVLKNRVLNVLRTNPPGLNIVAFKAKISEIYENARSVFLSQHENGPAAAYQQRQIMHLPSQYVQQPIRTRAQLPRAQRGMYGNTRMQNRQTNHLSITNFHTPSSIKTSTPSLINVTLKKLPFFPVVGVVLKPSIMSGHDRCTLQSFHTGNCFLF